MSDTRREESLRTIFSFFLGLMLTAFVGVGVYTFYPPPDQYDRQLRELSQQEVAVRNAKAPAAMTPADQEQLRGMEARRRVLNEQKAEAQKPWGRTTSMILIVFATAAMALSLLRAGELPVISNGLLLGGLFTMVYGTGWIISSDTSVTRFLVMTAALGISLGLGYARFVRRGRSGSGAATTVPGTSPAASGFEQFSDIERRLDELERRMSAASDALGRSSEPSSQF